MDGTGTLASEREWLGTWGGYIWVNRWVVPNSPVRAPDWMFVRDRMVKVLERETCGRQGWEVDVLWLRRRGMMVRGLQRLEGGVKATGIRTSHGKLQHLAGCIRPTLRRQT